jgi:hypothetical protein
LIGFLTTQSWFHYNSLIANGDQYPIIGKNWINNLFDLTTYGGSQVSSPSGNALLLPRGVFYFVAHLLTLNDYMAQRVWLSALVGFAMVSAAYLGNTLSLSKVSVFLMSIFYFYNPNTIAHGITNDVYLSALVVIPLGMAMIIQFSVIDENIPKLTIYSTVLALLMGIVSSNPPMLFLVALMIFFSPVLVFANSGKEASSRAFWAVGYSSVVILAAGSYWIVQEMLKIHSADISSLSSSAHWLWTESRYSLKNSFWLNNIWGWNVNSYYPFSTNFSQFPYSTVIISIPFITFGALLTGIAFKHRSSEFLRVRSTAAIGSLLLIILSLGTIFPGSLLFNELYRLPYGWILQEPDRLLIPATALLAILVGLCSEGFYPKQSFKIFGLNHQQSSHAARGVFVIIFIFVIFLSSFPLITGSIIRNKADGFPSAHVTIPSDWWEAERYLNVTQPPDSAILLLPTDDYYQMPFTWYYGADNFAEGLFKQVVINPVKPTAQKNYFKLSSDLYDYSKFVQSSLLKNKWDDVNSALFAMGTSMILVRQDVVYNFANRNIVNPNLLYSHLSNDPLVHLVFRKGKLSIFKMNKGIPTITSNFATLSGGKVLPGVISLVSPRTQIVNSHPIPGHSSIVRLDQCNWVKTLNFKTCIFQLENGWDYSIADSHSQQFENYFLKKLKSNSKKDSKYSVTISNSAPPPIIVGIPKSKDTTKVLITSETSYKKSWTISVSSEHVAVGSLRNGWLVNREFTSHYRIVDTEIQHVFLEELLLSLFGVLLAVLFVIFYRKNGLKQEKFMNTK